ncbi:MAG TPA: methyltransferase [Sphingobium sp.]|nr:methyltransferase [Sphingobium sp.]
MRRRGYHFVTPTPATHQLVVSRPDRAEARHLTDILGWSLPFSPDMLDPEMLDLLQEAGALIKIDKGRCRSAYRVSTVRGELLLHSAFPTEGKDDVFMGPDSYRFANLIAHELSDRPLDGPGRLIDIGAGTGVGAIVASRFCPDAQIFMTDINPHALRLARINAAAANVEACLVEGPNLDGLDGLFDLLLANPPYIADGANRAYRDGGSLHGGAVAFDMARKGLERLAPGGRFILYTGSAIVEGADILGKELAALADAASCALSYEELDPDVFGEELAEPAYRHVDRIAVIAAVFRR